MKTENKMASKEKLDEELEKLKLEYLTSVEEKVSDIESTILKLRKVSQRDRGALFREILRELHSIKGTAGSYGIHFVSKVCHNSEDFLQEVDIENDFSEEHESIMLKFIDLIKFYASNVINNSELNESELENNLKSIYGHQDNKMKILVAEPTRSFFNIYQATLADFDCHFYYTANGLTAFERILNIQYDFAIISKTIDTLSGLELIGCINSVKSRVGNLKTILVSSNKLNLENNNSKPDFFLEKNKDMAESLMSIVKEHK